MKNNVLATLAADISAGAVSLTLAPLNATAFVIPPGATDATGATTGGTPTYGEPFVTAMLIDRLDASQAKMEVMKLGVYTAPSGVHTFAIVERGAEGTAAVAWTAGALIVTPPTAEFLQKRTQQSVLRSQALAVHSRDALMSWNGTKFVFDSFKVNAAGRGKHWSTDGNYLVTFPGNAITAKGYGGAADLASAGGGWDIPINTALYYEPNINGVGASSGLNFRLVSWTADFVVPEHWLLIAVNASVNAGDKIVRVANGATLVAFVATPAFTNAWVNFGAPYYDSQFRKGADQVVELRGAIKTGAIGSAAFTLAAGYRPANTMRFAVESNGAYGCVEISSAGVVTPQVGSNTRVNLDGIRFLAEA